MPSGSLCSRDKRTSLNRFLKKLMLDDLSSDDNGCPCLLQQRRCAQARTKLALTSAGAEFGPSIRAGPCCRGPFEETYVSHHLTLMNSTRS